MQNTEITPAQHLTATMANGKVRKYNVNSRILSNEEFSKLFSSKLKLAREMRGWSQAETARYLGIPKSSLCAYENGGSVPSLNKTCYIADKLGVTVNWLVSYTGYSQQIKGADKYVL